MKFQDIKENMKINGIFCETNTGPGIKYTNFYKKKSGTDR